MRWWWRLGGGKTNGALADTSTGTVRAAGNRDVALVEERGVLRERTLGR